MKKFISFLLLTAMMLSLFPLGVLAETLDYEVIDYTTELTVGTEYVDYVDENDPMVKLDGYTFNNYVSDYMGYSQGYTVYLEEGKCYRFTVLVDGATSENVDLGIALLNNSFYSKMNYDVLCAYNTSNVDSWAELSFDFVCYESNYYYFLVSSILIDKNGIEIFGEENTITTINIEQLASYDEVDYYTSLELDQPLSAAVKSTGLEVYSSFAEEYGFAKGYSASLKAGYYDIDITLAEGDESNSEVFFMIYKDELSGTEEEDAVIMPSWQSFYVDSDGDYKILFFCDINDENGDSLIDEDGTAIEITLKETVFEPIYCYRKDDIIELKNIFEQVKTNTNTVKVIIKDDIDMTGYDWESIEVDYEYSSIVIEGNGHTIKGLSDGLFGYVENVFGVYDLTVDVDIKIDDKTLDIYDFGGLADEIYGTLIAKNIAVKGKMDIYADAIEDFGGFIGDIYSSVVYIDGCSTELDIDLSAEYYIGYAGGFFGYTYGYDRASYIKNSFANCDINVNSIEYEAYKIGGFAGDSDNRIYQNCYSDGAITLNEHEDNHYSIGGFVGETGEDAFFNCYSSVDVNATEKSECVGGFVGSAYNFVFFNSYSEGDVLGGKYVGGLVGESTATVLINSYSTSDVSGVCYIGGLVGYAYEIFIGMNVYTSGTVSVIPSDIEFPIPGSLVGYVESYNNLILQNVFTYSSNNIGIISASVSDGGNAEKVLDAVTVVDFKNDDEVNAMTELLNSSVEEFNTQLESLLESSPVEFLLSNWEGKNADNGPILVEKLDEPENPADPTYLLGDVDGDNDVDADDYIILKRIYFGQAKLGNLKNPETAEIRSDVNKDGKINADDYILLKRVYFGQAKL